MDWNVDAAVDALERVPVSNRPASASKLGVLLSRRHCCAVKVHSLVTPLDLAKALLPLLEDNLTVQSCVKQFAEIEKENEITNEVAQAAAKRTAVRLKASDFFSKQVLKERGLYLASQAYGLMEVKPEELVAELVRRGLVSEDGTSGRLQYNDSITAESKSARKENKCWDWSFWGSLASSSPNGSMTALPENGSAEDPTFTIKDLSLVSSFFGRGGSYVAALRKTFGAMGMRLEVLVKQNAITFHYKGGKPPVEAIQEIVLMIAGPTAPVICKHPARRGRVTGGEIDAISTRLQVRICRVKSLLHIWPTAHLLIDCKKSELPGAARQLREATEKKSADVATELREIFDKRTLEQATSENTDAYLYRKERRAQRQAAHIQKVGPGSGNHLAGAAHEFQKNDRAYEMQRDKMKREARKEHLQDRDWRKKYGGKVNRDKKPPRHGGRHKAGEGAVDDEGVQKLSQLARAPSVIEDVASATAPAELKDTLHEMADLWCTGSASKPSNKFNDLKSSLTHQQVCAWNDAVREFGESIPDSQSLAIKAYTLFKASNHSDS